jgi:hypothetical protein
MMGDLLLGKVIIDVDALCFNQGVNAYFDLFLKNIKAGKLFLKTKFVDKNLS